MTGRMTRWRPSTSSGSTRSGRWAISPRRACCSTGSGGDVGRSQRRASGRATWPGCGTFLPVNELQSPHKPVGGADNMLHGAGQWELEPRQALDRGIRSTGGDLLVDPDVRARLDGALGLRQPGDQPERRAAPSRRRRSRPRRPLHSDPGVQNWLDTSGLAKGLFTYRYVRPTTAPAPRTTLVNMAALRDLLPPSTPAWSASMRQDQITARRRGVARRFRR